MTNAGFTQIDDYRDVQTLNEYHHRQNTGADLNQFLKEIGFGSRDNGRTPFQWDSSVQAGFTTGVPWIKVNTKYKDINQEKENSEILS